MHDLEGRSVDELCSEALLEYLSSINTAVAEVSHLSSQTHDEYSALLKTITEKLADLLLIERASVWLYDDGNLIAHDIFELSKQKHSSGLLLRKGRYPKYFKALTNSRVLDIVDVFADSRVKELNFGYHDTNHIASMLAVSIYCDGKLLGIVCCEHTGYQRQWGVHEQSFVVAMADQIARAHTEKKRADVTRELTQQNSRYNAIINNTQEVFALLDENGHYIYASPYIRDLLGISPDTLVGLRVGTFARASDRDKIEAVLEEILSKDGAREKTLVLPVPTPGGGFVTISATLKNMLDVDGVNAILLRGRNIEGQRIAERQLERVQKMELLGSLSAGIAHDFNNLLAIINGNLEFIEDQLQDRPELLEAIQDVKAAGWRGAEITDRLMKVSNSPQQKVSPTSIEKGIHNAHRILLKSAPANISLIIDMQTPKAACMMNPSEYEDVILNLAINAITACAEGCTVTISTELKEISGITNGISVTENYCVVKVTDDGIGIPSRHLDKIFEPFFTTQKSGESSGLGLAMVYGFVSRVGGDIKVSSKIGRGSCFELYLPLCKLKKAEATILPKLMTPVSLAGKTALIVDDEPEIIKLVRRLLHMHKMDIFEAPSGDEAKIVLEGLGSVDLLVSDIVMPGKINGLSLAKLVRKKNSAQNILLMTGYSEDLLEDAGHTLTDGLIRKPFRKEEFVQMINSLDFT